MAEFCRQCSISLWNLDRSDFRAPPGMFERHDCAGCGAYVLVDDTGRCVDFNCPVHGLTETVVNAYGHETNEH